MEKSIPPFEKVVSDQELKNATEKERQEKVEQILTLVEKMNESGKAFPFPGIHKEAYRKMKETDDEFPGFTTPTDEIIERCKKEGIKIVAGKHPESGNVFVLPADSDNIEMDSIAPHQLEIGMVENEYLRELIELTTKK